MNYTIEPMQAADWQQVKQIYLEGIATGLATFQTGAPTWDDWDQGHLQCSRYVARNQDTILGFVALSPTSSRCCYKGVAEVSIYIGEKYKHQGVGTSLLKEAIVSSESNGIWSLYSAIIGENQPSIALHNKCGFRMIGTREKVAQMPNGLWHDVVLMERRSKIIG